MLALSWGEARRYFRPALAGSGSGLSGINVGKAYTFIATQMPAGNPGGLSTAEYTNVLAYILSRNGTSGGNDKPHTRVREKESLHSIVDRITFATLLAAGAAGIPLSSFAGRLEGTTTTQHALFAALPRIAAGDWTRVILGSGVAYQKQIGAGAERESATVSAYFARPFQRG